MASKLLKIFRSAVKRLKIFDWILIGLGLAAVVIFAFLFFRKSSYIVATVKVGGDSVFYPSWVTNWADGSGSKNWFASLFHNGQVEKDGLGRIRAEVLNVYSYDKSPTRKTVYLTVRLNVVYNRASNTYTYKGVPVLIGSKIKLDLDEIYVESLVTEVQGSGFSDARKKIVIEAQAREENSTFLETAGTKSYIADAIKVGDVVKNNHGEVIIKVLDKKVLPAQRITTASDGRALLRDDPVRKDLYLTLEVETIMIEDKYFLLDDIPILIDQPIPFNTPSISIFPVVTKFLSY